MMEREQELSKTVCVWGGGGGGMKISYLQPLDNGGGAGTQ